MNGEFVNPNWHVVLMHFPIGLLGAGVLIELIALGWPGRGLRAAGRWMMLLGALAAVPTLLAGLYALRDTVLGATPPEPGLKWHELAARSPWTAKQWAYMTWHIWLNSSAVAIFALAAVAGLAVNGRPRTRLHLPLFILVLAGFGLVSAGAWFGGEAVYRLGTAVVFPGHAATPPATSHEEPGSTPAPPAAVPKPPETTTTSFAGLQTTGSLAAQLTTGSQASGATTAPLPAAAAPAPTPAGRPNAEAHDHEGHERDGHGHNAVEPAGRGLTYFIPPLQLHLVLAGVAIAFALGALGLTIRRWQAPPEESDFHFVQRGHRPVLARPGPHAAPPPSELPAGEDAGFYDEEVEPPASPRPFWLLAGLCLALTSLSGMWSFMGNFTPEAWKSNLEMLRDPDHRRVLVHVGVGVMLLALALLHAIPRRLGWTLRPLSKIIAAMLLLALLAQLWLGIAILFDSYTGPLHKFQPPPAVAGPRQGGT